MRYRHARALVLIGLAAPLGACSSFLGIHLSHRAAPAEPVQAAAAPAPAVQVVAQAESATALGRKQLADGQTGLAIESFQKALAAGEPIAPAVNGLGVAYARLGRLDLAQRYFQQAAASDPADSRYADNLVRVTRSLADRDVAQLARQSAAPPPAVRPAQPVLGQLQRVSRGEVRIATAPAQAAPLAAKSAEAFKPLVRISLADPAASAAPAGAIRIVLPEPKPADAATIAAAAKAEAGAAAR